MDSHKAIRPVFVPHLHVDDHAKSLDHIDSRSSRNEMRPLRVVGDRARPFLSCVVEGDNFVRMLRRIWTSNAIIHWRIAP